MNWSSDRVLRVDTFIYTSFGIWNAPTIFLYESKSTPVFPPMLLSTCARRLVGICTKSMPLRYVAAVNPVISPVTPPPRAISISFLSNLA